MPYARKSLFLSLVLVTQKFRRYGRDLTIEVIFDLLPYHRVLIGEQYSQNCGFRGEGGKPAWGEGKFNLVKGK